LAGNAKVHDTTKEVLAEVFELERQHLLPVPQQFDKKSNNNI